MTSDSNNQIYIRRAGKILVPKGTGKGEITEQHIAALLKNIESLGYILSSKVIKRLEGYTLKEIDSFHNQLVKELRQLVGANVRYRPMYPNFPRQVMEASELELFINAHMHYLGDWVGARIMPKYRKKPRPKLADEIVLKVLDIGTDKEFNTILTNLLQAKVSYSLADKEDLLWFMKQPKINSANYLPDIIPSKENLAIASHYILTYTKLGPGAVAKYFKTATDVLRLAVAKSDGDVSLAEPTKFIAFKRSDRRFLLELLEQCDSLTEDMLRRPEAWKRLGERLHPFEYKNRYTKCADAFDTIRNDKPFTTFHSQVESFIKAKDMAEAVKLLSTRPGELARRLDHLLRLNQDPGVVLKAFDKVAGEVSSPVLLQLMTHFKHRNQQRDTRVFFPKGNVARAQAVENTLPDINDKACQAVVATCQRALIDKYKQLPSLGKVYIEPALKQYTVPMGLRSASRALKTLGRGSRLLLPEDNTIRFFIWWADGKDRTDLDLSALGLDSNSRFKMQIAYYNLRELGGYHSGDITSAPDGASEFIDLDREVMYKAGIRYIVMCVNSYTEQPFYELPECFAGFMVRQKPHSGEIYDPRTVENRIDLTSNTHICLPLIIDLKKNEVLWTDLGVTQHPSRNNNILNNMSSLTLMNIAMTSLVKPTLYDLFELHAKARGQLVAAAKPADTVFAVQEGITPYQTERIVGEFL